MEAPTDESYVKIGDLCSFFCDYSSDIRGFVTSDGFAETNVSFDIIPGEQPSINNFQDAVFEIHTALNFTAQNAYHQALDASSLTGSQGSFRRSAKDTSDATLLDLKQKYEQEVRHNEQLQRRSVGQFVCYGHTVVLRHVKSSNWLRVRSDTAATKNNDAMAVQVGRQDEHCLFTVRPRYKLHSEGERVHVGNQVVLINNMTKLNIHIDLAHMVAEDKYEINALLSTVNRGLQLMSYASCTQRERSADRLSGGDVIRFYNKENDGYLMVSEVDGQDNNIHFPHLYASRTGIKSTNTLFMVEHVASSTGRFVTWRDPIRLKHVGTSLYLCASEDATRLMRSAGAGQNVMRVEKQRDSEIMMALTNDVTDVNSLFFVEPFYAEEAEGEIGFRSTFRLLSAEKRQYVTVFEERFSAEKAEGKDDEEAMAGADALRRVVRKHVGFTDKARDEDTLVFVGVSDQEMYNLNVVKGVVPVLQEYTATFRRGELPSTKSNGLTRRIQKVLCDLIMFVQDVPREKQDQNPLVIDEKPINERQKVVMEQDVLDFILVLINAPFDTAKGKGVMKLEEMTNNQSYKAYFHVAQLGYRLVKQTIKGCSEVRMSLSTEENVDLMQSHLGYRFKTADTLMELFTDNRHLLDRLTDKQILVFVELIKSVGKMSRYINFLNALITCEGKGHSANQRRVCKALLVDNLKECAIVLKLEGGGVVVDLNSARNAQDAKPQAEWVLLQQFLKRVTSEQAAYLERMLVCFSNLCRDRNNYCIEIVSSLFPYQLCFLGATALLEGRGYGIRAGFIQILQTVYIDTDPHEKVAKINLTRTWKGFDIDIPRSKYLDKRLPHEEHQETDTGGETDSGSTPRIGAPFGGKRSSVLVEMAPIRRGALTRRQLAMDNPSELETRMFDQVDFGDLKAFVVAWVQSCHNQVAEEVSKNSMTLAVLGILEELLRHGFFGAIRELQGLAGPLLECLDGRDDVQEVGQNPEDAEATSQRFVVTAENSVITQCKQQVISVLKVMTDLRADYRITLLLKMFEDKVGETRSYVGTEADGSVRTPRGGLTDPLLAITTTAQATVKTINRAIVHAVSEDPTFARVFQTLPWVSTTKHGIVDVMMDCSLYDYQPLVSASFAVLIRNFSQRLMLLDSLKNTQILVSEESEGYYLKAESCCRLIRSLIKPKMTDDDEAKIRVAVDQLENIAFDKRTNRVQATNQHILRSVGAHDDVHRLLQLPFTNDLPHEQARREVFLACYRFLRNFAMRSTNNQSVLLDHVPFYMTQMGVKLKAAEVISEVFRDNRRVCSQIKDETIRHFVMIIDERGRFSRYLKFFQVIIKPEGRPLSRNQDLVLKALIEKRKCMLTYSSEEGRDRRRELLAKDDEDSKEAVNYHVTLVDLLADIVQGPNKVTVAKCRGWLTLEDCILTLRDDQVPLSVKSPFVKYAAECYANVDKVIDPSVMESLWDLVTCFPALLAKTREETHTEFFTQTCNFATRFASVSISYSSDWREQEFTTFATDVADTARHLNTDDLTGEAALKRATRAMIDCAMRVDKDVFAGVPIGDNVINLDLAAIVGESAFQQSLEDQEDRDMRESLRKFVAECQQKLGLSGDGSQSSEFQELIKIFVDPTPEITARVVATPEVPEGDAHWEHGNMHTLKLINQVMRLTDKELDLKRICLKIVLRLACLEDLSADPPLRLEMSQNRLDKIGEFSHPKYMTKTCGATRLCLQMMVDPEHQSVLKEVLHVSCALLENGNKTVQHRVLKYFQGPNGVGFFESIRELIRIGCNEVTDQISYHRRVKELRVAMPGATDADINNTIPPFIERAQMELLLTFIQYTCEGHNREIQDYWRVQNARRTYDIVSEIADYVSVLYRAGINVHNASICVQAFQTLTELMQGPCPGNQSILSTSKLPETCNRILMSELEECSEEQTQNIKEETALSMSALLEGCNDPTLPAVLANEFNTTNLFSILTETHKLYNETAIKTDDKLQERLETAFQVFTFVLTIKDFVPLMQIKLEEDLAQETYEFFLGKTGKIEINQRGELARVYFRLPEICSRLTDTSKKELLWAVDRTSATKKLDDFLELSDDLEAEMIHQQKMSTSRVAPLTTDFAISVTNKTAIFLALLINVLMLFIYEDPRDAEVHNIGDKGGFTVIWIVGILLAVFEVLRFTQLSTIRAALIIRKGFKSHTNWLGDKSPQEYLNNHERTLSGSALFCLRAGFFLLANKSYFVELLLLVSSILGMVLSPLFFSAHLAIFMVETSQDLKNVLASVTLNGKSLVITAVFGVMLIYLLAIWAFLSLRDKYQDTADYPDLCSDLFQCTLITLHSGLRKGDIGDVLNDSEWGDGEFIAFQLVYFAVIITIMLNIIFGIIIDTFGELRQFKADTEDDILNKCFICSIDRYTFDRLTEGFVFHTKHEHNMWEYLFFLVHLNSQNPNDYTGPESYCKELIDANDTLWFPVNRALSLLEHHRQEHQAQNELLELAKTSASQTKELENTTAKIQSQLTDIHQLVVAMNSVLTPDQQRAVLRSPNMMKRPHPLFRSDTSLA